MKFTAACIQLNSGNDIDTNIKTATMLIADAAGLGADFIALPENTAFMLKNPADIFTHATIQEESKALIAFCNAAKEHKKWLLIGSLAIKVLDKDKLLNRSFLINSDGIIAATYDKIHLFDTSVKGGETHRESDRFMPGDKEVIAETPFGKMGMTICYDVRFPQLYRKLAQDGAGIITVPAAFTEFTGKAHWHILLRARAIETGSFIIAPAQTGTHPSGRKTYGHSLIIDPWGEILAEAGKDVGIITAVINTDKIWDTRKQMPSINNFKFKI